YMAPEQARGDGTEIGVRCDVYSLGVIVYQMLTGELPITGNSVADLLVNLLIEPPIPLREKVTGLPDALCEMVRRSLSKEQVDRQSTVTQFYDEFLAAIAGAQPELRGVPLNDTLPISDDDSLSSAQTVAASDLASHGATGRTTMPRGSLVSNQTATAETLLASGRSRMPLIFATFSVMTLLIVAAIFIYVKVVPHRKKEAEKPVAPKPVAMAPAPMVAKKKPIKPAKKPVSIPEGYKKMKNIRGSDLCFFMGDEKGEEAEKPAHMVCLSPYAMDRTEVTVAHYAKCVDAGKCSVPKESDDKSEQHNCNWGKKDRASHPVNCVDWNQANNYCQWAKKRLPTEAEWEFAARGKNRNTLFPWGEKSGDCKLSIVWDDGSNMSGCGKGGTWPVGSRPKGASSFGIHDLVGNVWEWVADFYDPGYYKSVASSMVRDPKGPAKPTASRVLRGGAFNTNAVKATFRAGKVENVRMTHIGFRCARTLPPAKK
ncbi:SUMF1/EgtB/PvdO family nonheme iron enzyme, partial [Myxococcota bacterium]|nr:SUMF1/EgtB/PvdO family nonheme iron enzyme [Myxococcota bacterium]